MANKDITSEKVLEKLFSQHIKSLGGESIKLLPHLMNGLPDRLALLPGGFVLLAEIKSKGKKLTLLQQRWAEKLKGLGFTHYVIDSSESLIKFKHETESRFKKLPS